MVGARELYQKYHAAIASKDFAGARQLLHDNLIFNGPIDSFNNAGDYLEAIKKLAAIVKGVEIKKMFVDGSDLCALYHMITSRSAGTAS